MAGKKEAGTATTRVTAAQVNAKVVALAETVESLENGIGSIVEMLTEERAAKKIAEAKSQILADNAAAEQRVEQRVPDGFKSEPAPVGQRQGDVYVRNLHERAVRVRVGKQSDPYRINLSPRGQKGDTVAVPASLRGDLNYKNNLGVAYEEISDEQMAALAGRRSKRRIDPELEKARRGKTVRDEDRTVARMRDQTPEDRLTRVGPRYVDLPGSHNPSNELADSELTWADAESDPEYRQFLEFKAAQRAARAGQGADYEQAQVQGQARVREQVTRDRIDAAATSGDPEAQAMARYIRRMEAKGVLPAGELDKPVTLERATISVQPNVRY